MIDGIRRQRSRTVSNACLGLICATIGGFTTMAATGGGTAITIEHPVLDYGIDKAQASTYERAVRPIMGMTDDDVLSFVPPRGYINYCECPACYGGVEGNRVLTWDIAEPNQLTCRFCGTVVLPNAAYPETKTMAGKNRLSEDVRLHYYHNEERNARHFLSHHLWRHKRKWLLDQCIGLGKAYQATGKEIYARRAVLVLDRFAQVYPHYPALHNRFPPTIKFCDSQEPPYSWNAGRWGYFHDEIPKPVIAIYDLVCSSPEFDNLSEKRGYDIRVRLEDDFLRETHRIAACSTFIITNVVGYDIAGVATLGRVINEPAYVHQAFRWMMRNVDEGFFRDGLWSESPSYYYMSMGGLRSAFGKVRGHSDPTGYVDAVDGTRFDDFDPMRDVPFLAVVMHAPSVLDFPNGCSVPVHDTWPGERRSKARDQTVSTIAPAYGHASLGRGTGDNQMQAQLHFSGAYGHSHRDNLSMCLFAKGREMLSDIGYTWTQMACWTTSTVAHNTVVVDRTRQGGGRAKSSGDLLRFFPDTSGFSLVDADGQRGYAQCKGVDAYRRTLLMVPVSNGDAYVIDLFRARGGTIHDWALHGDADEGTTATCSLALSGERKSMLEPDEEKDWQDPDMITDRYHPYGMIRDVGSIQTPGAFTVDFAYIADPARRVRLHMDAGDAEVLLGRAPSVRRMGKGHGGDMRKAYDFWMPQLLVRRRGVVPLQSAFVAVEEPCHGEPFIHSVERLSVAGSGEGAVALRVTHTAGVDTIISLPDGASSSDACSADGVTLRGVFGIVRRSSPGGPVTAARLFEGTELSCQSVRLESAVARFSGRIVACERKLEGAPADAFVVDAELPTGNALQKTWMIVTHADGTKQGHEIDRVEVAGGSTRVILAREHGLQISKPQTREVYFPRRIFKGLPSYAVPVAVALDHGD
ncbi:MAG: hypothetical protein HON70_38135 [Lentisphaerae bacterium]|nr:hypothetical protein [Lentisphaerota bacterium]